MSFVLEELNLDDYTTITKDAAYDNQLKQTLISAYEYKSDGFKDWAIDSEHGYYMFSIPSMVNDGAMGTMFYLFYKKKFYKVETLSSFCNRVVVDDFSMLLPSIKTDFQRVLTEAFAVCGRFGSGIVNSQGDPEFLVKPEIVERSD